MKRILFVDDEPKVLAGLRRMLRSLRRQWEMEFVQSGPEALERLGQAPFDVVVTDMRMPGMDGSQLLDEVTRRHPATVRIILSGQCDRQAVLKAVGPTHQFLTKPCDSETLKSTVAGACTLRDRLADDRLKQVVTRVRSLPVQAAAQARLLAELESPAPSIQHLGEIVARDVGMAAKVIQLVNSGFFGTPQRVSDLAHALNLLGLDTLRALVLTTDALSPEGPGCRESGCLEAMNDHSLAVARAAREIARTETDDATLISDAYLAGLLHEVGGLVLAEERPGTCVALSGGTDCQSVCEEPDGLAIRPASDAHGCHSAARPRPCWDDVGAYLMELWGAPEPIVKAIGLRRCPARSSDGAFSPLAAVHVAAAVLARDPGDPGENVAPVDTGYLQRIGCADRLDGWRLACRTDCWEGVSA